MSSGDAEEARAFRAALIAEGAVPAETEEEYLAAWQLLVDTGLCWRLQGWFGRTAAALIEAGMIRPKTGADGEGLARSGGRADVETEERTDG